MKIEPKLVQTSQILNLAKDVCHSASVAKFRQIWSHCLQDSGDIDDVTIIHIIQSIEKGSIPCFSGDWTTAIYIIVPANVRNHRNQSKTENFASFQFFKKIIIFAKKIGFGSLSSEISALIKIVTPTYQTRKLFCSQNCKIFQFIFCFLNPPEIVISVDEVSQIAF